MGSGSSVDRETTNRSKWTGSKPPWIIPLLARFGPPSRSNLGRPYRSALLRQLERFPIGRRGQVAGRRSEMARLPRRSRRPPSQESRESVGCSVPLRSNRALATLRVGKPLRPDVANGPILRSGGPEGPGTRRFGHLGAAREWRRRMRLPRHWLQLAALFDHVDDVLAWVKDRDGRYGWVNRAFLINYSLDGRRVGAAPEPGDVIGKTDYDFSPAFLADQFRLDDEYVLAGHRIVNRIELVGQPDGRAVWNVTNKIPLVDDRGAVIGTAGITRRLALPGQADAPRHEFGPVLAHLRDHYRTPITNRQLARLAHMSVRAFERKFQASFHLTPQTYLRKLRLRMASRALVYTGETLAEIASGCGFSDQSHFTREFRRHFGRTPRDYREHYARDAGDAAPVPKLAADDQERPRRGRYSPVYPPAERSRRRPGTSRRPPMISSRFVAIAAAGLLIGVVGPGRRRPRVRRLHAPLQRQGPRRLEGPRRRQRPLEGRRRRDRLRRRERGQGGQEPLDRARVWRLRPPARLAAQGGAVPQQEHPVHPARRHPREGHPRQGAEAPAARRRFRRLPPRRRRSTRSTSGAGRSARARCTASGPTRKTPPDLRAAVTPRHQADKPVGEWNHFEITVNGKTVDGRAERDDGDPRAPRSPTCRRRGRLALQHHGSKNKRGEWTGPPSLVQFRNIRSRSCRPGPRRPARPPSAIRALLITGGHDHDAAFYSLFDGYEELDRLPVDTAANAFKKDLRGKYDVIIMYDFTRDLDEAGRKNLRDFVEAGKGVVVLHHALLNYQNWTWWSEEVVGGRYRLQREGEAPSSSVKNDQQISVTPAGPHPVLDGHRAVPHPRRGVQEPVDVAEDPAAADHRQPDERHATWPGSARARRRGWSPSSSATATRRSGIRPTGPWCTTPSSGRPGRPSDGRPTVRRPRERNRDEAGTLQHHLPGPLVPRQGAHAPADDHPGQGVRLRRDRDRRQAAARQPARLADGPLPRAAIARPTARGSTSTPWPPTTTSATPCPRSARPRSASSAS